MSRAWSSSCVAALIVVAVPGFHEGADAMVPVKCTYDDDAQKYECRGEAAVTPGTSDDEPLGDSPIRWSRVAFTLKPTCYRKVKVPIDPDNRPPGVPPGVTEYELEEHGQFYVVSITNTATDDLIATENVCVYPCVGNTSPPTGAFCSPPEPPPPPPGFDVLKLAIGEAVDLKPTSSPSAAIGGLTGLETWLWCQQPGPITPGVELNGWTAQVDASLVRVDWEMEGPSAALRTSSGCGSEAEPAARWMPETMGAHTIATTATYTGTWTLSGVIEIIPGVSITIPPQTFPLADAVIPGVAVDYPVDEQIGVLTG